LGKNQKEFLEIKDNVLNPKTLWRKSRLNIAEEKINKLEARDEKII
jgi:hypothetical protein